MASLRRQLPLVAPTADVTPTSDSGDVESPVWAKIIDQSRCIGCHACTTACKSENEVPLSVSRTYVKSVDVGDLLIVEVS